MKRKSWCDRRKNKIRIEKRKFAKEGSLQKIIMEEKKRNMKEKKVMWEKREEQMKKNSERRNGKKTIMNEKEKC